LKAPVRTGIVGSSTGTELVVETDLMQAFAVNVRGAALNRAPSSRE